MSRKTVRERLATLFAGQGFTQVNGHAPLDLAGATKVLNIYSAGSRPDFISKHLQNSFYSFNLDTFVKRAGGESAEDDLDDLHETVVSVIKAHIKDDNWSHLELADESECLFAEVSGVPYRVERHKLRVKVTS